MPRVVLLLLLPSLLCSGPAGCQPYVQAQIDLADQARHGLELARQSQGQSRDAIEQLHALQRRQLDEAFDADVRDRASLDAAWVIAHRKAYALGLDALAHEQLASRAAHERALRNLAAADAALQRLRWLQSLQLKWFQINREQPEERP